MINNCADCGVAFECTGDEMKGTTQVCTHAECPACNIAATFSHGIPFPNPSQVQAGIYASYKDTPFVPSDLQVQIRYDDPEGFTRHLIDPFTGDLYVSPGEQVYIKRDASHD